MKIAIYYLAVGCWIVFVGVVWIFCLIGFTVVYPIALLFFGVNTRDYWKHLP